MVLTTHQPIFLPWPGFFFKAMQADVMVLLDDVQFPLGRGWMNRNRLKSDNGMLWLTVPVWKKGRGKQIIRNVRIYNEEDWRKKHLRSILHYYANAPYLDNHYPMIESIYMQKHELLIHLNIDLIRYFWSILGLRTKLILQSELGIFSKGTDLILQICRSLNAGQYITFPIIEKYLDLRQFKSNNIKVNYAQYHPPIYPQLWGDFIYNLSTLDLLLNCGSKSQEIILHA